jgi:glutamyl-tRNA synthetase
MSKNSDKKVITRFPPSPTGYFHVGSVRTALFNYLFSHKNKGSFILRIEDTDKERSKKEFEEDIFYSLKWLGLKHDNKEVFKQSERTEVYKKYLQKLIDSGHAYISKENLDEKKKEELEKDHKNAEFRKEVIRFKNPGTTITFLDLIRGEVSMDTTDLKDFVIAKSLDEPLYHLAVVVDDIESGITHIIRGEDHISNTPRQILILEALGASRPVYAHLPLILAPDRSKLSKRKHGEKVSLKYYREQGYLPEAIINYVALLGWNPGTDQEIFTLKELIEAFDMAKVQKSGAIFDEEKLKWINKQHILRMDQNEVGKIMLEKVFYSMSVLTKGWEVNSNIWPIFYTLLIDRIHSFGEIPALIDSGEFDYIFEDPEYDKAMLNWKGKEDRQALSKKLEEVITLVKNIDEKNFNRETVKSALWDYATKEGRGEVLWPMRVALSGKEKSPDPFVLAELLGKEVTLHRIEKALEKVSHG